MKRLLVAALCVIGFASAYAEPMDHWEITGSTMTDGEWTFNVTKRPNKIADTDIYDLYVNGCTGCPDYLTTLDFDKPVVYTEGTTQYAITQIQPGFNGSEAGQRIEVLKLPTHGYNFNIGNGYGGGNAFANCTNLVSVVPFLPTNCVDVGQGCFSGCVKLSTPLKIEGGKFYVSGFFHRYDFEKTAIPSADLENSGITKLTRDVFRDCKSLVWVKLPKALTEFADGDPFTGCDALYRADFYAVPPSLGVFDKCYGLTEIHFHHCAPSTTRMGAPVFCSAGRQRILTTWLHLDDSETDALAAWAAQTEGGMLGEGATWAAAATGNIYFPADYRLRPIRRYVDRSSYHIGVEALEDADEGTGKIGSFRFFRAEDDLDDEPISAKLVIGGNAVNGRTCRKVWNSVQIPAGERSVTLRIHPQFDPEITADSTLTLTLGDSEATLIEGKTTGTIVIRNGETFGGWRIIGGSMTDGDWTFTVALRTSEDSIDMTPPMYRLYVQGCTKWPDGLSTLDFSKTIVNEREGDANCYEILQIQNQLPAEARDKVERLRLPTHGMAFSLAKLCGGCKNLVSVEPFLPPNCTIGEYVFSGCEKLATPLVYSGSCDFTPWGLFEGTAIPSVDLSESTVTTLERACFSGCASLKTVKLPPTLTTLTGGILPFNGCTALELIEFQSVPSSLSAFSGCTALKEVRFYHCAPDTVSAGIYNQLNQDITTYLYLDDEETEAIENWGALTAGGELIGESTWAAAYAGSVALEKRPLLRYSAKHISLAAGQDGGVIAGRPGTFVVSRADGDSLGGSVMVNYTISGGTAQEGVHFEPLSGLVAIPSGEKSGVIEVSPEYFAYIGTETLTIKLAAGDYEIVEGEDEATISLATEEFRSISIAKGGDADEGAGTVGHFILSRGEGDSIDAAVDVALAIGGTAVPGQTYGTIKNVVTIPAGEKSVKVRVNPYDDQTAQEDTTVEVTVLPGGYGIGTDSATVAVKNGETYGGWKFVDGTHISDGKWTFTVSRRPSEKYDDGVYHLWVQSCTAWPEEPLVLDFDKAFQNVYDKTVYAMQSFDCKFDGNAEARSVLQELVLPDDPNHPYAIQSGAFVYCANLVSVKPFLSKSCTLCRGAFRQCYNITNALSFYGKAILDDGSSAAFMECCKIPSADFSESTITMLHREDFAGCTALQWVKLPSTCKRFATADGDSLNDRDPFRTSNPPNPNPYPDPTGLTIYFAGTEMPTNRNTTAEIGTFDFTAGLASLSDNAFQNYTGLTNVVFHGLPPAEIGENLFSGLKEKSVVINVPAYYIAEWRVLADDGKLSWKRGGTWTSGTTQILAPYGDPRGGLLIIVR